ncbi:MAG TPA: hypothetical protein VMU72_07840 [Gaiellaceae bacterium]|nr:hypothetical protein [Gaiellaceae bacterium]HVC86591.1 hypothetical protein [Gaiellaceae bacterium]
MHSRTKTWLIGAALTVLAVAFAAALGASSAAAASQHVTKVKIHKISGCGYTASVSGTYELTKNVTDSGSTCITLNANNITLYLDGHTITGTGSDTCLYVEGGGTSLSTNETVIGGTKLKPTKTATLTNCKDGLYVYWTSGTKASHLNIVAPMSYGVYEYYAGGMTLSNINVPLHSNTAYGFYLNYGADNVVTKSTVDNNGSDASFYVEYEVGDALTWDSAKDTYSTSGNNGYGFEDYYSSRNIYSHDTSKGQYDGFYLDPDSYGPVTVTYDSATGPSGNSNSYGFYINGAYQEADYASPFHTLVSHDKASGFQYGFYDESENSYAVAEKWIDNTADNYSEYGFYIYYPTDYTMTGNIADANTGTKKYDGASTSYGFYLFYPYSYYPFASFSKNQAYDSQYGFYSDEYMVGGKGNVAKRNKYNSYDVEITG